MRLTNTQHSCQRMSLSIAFQKQCWYSTDTTLSNWSVGGAAPRRWARSSVLKWNSFKRKTSPFNHLMNRANKQHSHLVFILVNLKNVQTMTAKQIQHARRKDVLFPNCLQNNPSCVDWFCCAEISTENMLTWGVVTSRLGMRKTPKSPLLWNICAQISRV
jgi:hypothetical protein